MLRVATSQQSDAVQLYRITDTDSVDLRSQRHWNRLRRKNGDKEVSPYGKDVPQRTNAVRVWRRSAGSRSDVRFHLQSQVVLGSAWALKTVGTAAISAAAERQGSIVIPFLAIAMSEALAVYGLIVGILLVFNIPSAA